MITRGEGGGNAVGTEIGPALGLRRENEDRVAHYRSGTVDIFNLDKRRLLLQPERARDAVLLGPRRDARPRHADHPHDAAGRLHRLHADARRRPRQPPVGRPHDLGGHATRRPNPSLFPDQLDGPHALEHVAGQEDLLRRQHRRHRRHDDGRRLHDRLHPDARARTSTPSSGVWTGYDSPYLWPAGQRPGQAGRHAEDLGAGRDRGRVRLPDAEPRDEQGHREPGLLALRPDVGRSCRSSRTRTRTARRTRSPARTTRSSTARPSQDPGGLPLGTLEYLTFDRFYNVAGQPFQATLHLKAPGAASIPAGTAALTVPAGWTVDAAKPIGADRRAAARRPSTFTVTPSAAAVAHELQDLGALHERRDRPATPTTSCASSRPSRAGSTAGASGPSSTSGSTTLAPQALPARPLGRGAVDGHRRDDQRCRSTSTTGRRRRRAAR